MIPENIMEYIQRVGQYILEEEQRVELHFPRSTLGPVMECFKTIFLDTQLDRFQEEFKTLFVADRTDDLEKMIKFFIKLNVDNLVTKYLLELGFATIEGLDESQRNDPRIYVSTISKLVHKFDKLLPAALTNNTGLKTAIRTICVELINNNAITRTAGSSQKSAELLARYCHVMLMASKTTNEMDLKDSFTQVVTVFDYIEDKDVFERFYTKLLANRLVSNKSANVEAEKDMVAKLKNKCCVMFSTRKLEGMLKDIEVSTNLNIEFQTHLKEKGDHIPFQFQIKVLTTATWPIGSIVELSLPFVFEDTIKKFNSFYKTLHDGRKLTWLYNHSNGAIVTNCYTSRYILQASTFQMAVLLMFNSQNEYRVGELVEATKIKLEILKQVLASLFKARLLTTAEDHDLSEDTIVRFNENYKNQKLKVNINVSLKTEGKPERDQTYHAIQEDRKFLLQAAIVRIMKAKKVCKHQQLVEAVLPELGVQFQPNGQMIMKCINLLIEKDYLKRTEGQSETYSYVA